MISHRCCIHGRRRSISERACCWRSRYRGDLDRHRHRLCRWWFVHKDHDNSPHGGRDQGFGNDNSADDQLDQRHDPLRWHANGYRGSCCYLCRLFRCLHGGQPDHRFRRSICYAGERGFDPKHLQLAAHLETVATRDERKVGDQSDFSVRVDFGESVNLVPLTKTFTMKTLDFQTTKISAASAEATDITSEVAGPSAPLLSVWELYYEPTASDVDTKGDYLGYFTVQYAGSEPRYYPSNDEYIQIEIASS